MRFPMSAHRCRRDFQPAKKESAKSRFLTPPFTGSRASLFSAIFRWASHWPREEGTGQHQAHPFCHRARYYFHGHGISGTLQLNMALWIVVVCFFVGGIAVAMLLFKL